MKASGIGEQFQLSLKLMVHQETNKVLFAEVGKDFVDVLISFLTLPLGTIARLVAKDCDMGPLKIASLSSLYESVSNLGDEYMWKDTCKKMLLQPRNPMEDYCRSLKLNVDDTDPTKYYVCKNFLECQRAPFVMCSTFKNKACSCGNLLEKQISPKNCISFDGFVKNSSCFMVTDDLCLLPMSLDAMFSIIKKMGIEDMSSLKEIVVDVTKNKLIDLLKCLLVSKTPFTDVFLRKKPCLQKPDCKIVCPSDSSEEQCTPVKVKLMYQKSDGKIVCAQGKEDFANFLLSILTFPLGAVVRLLQGNSSMGSVDGLYKSVVDLNEDLFNTKEVKAKLVDLGLAPQFKLCDQVIPISEIKAPEYYCVSKSSKSRITELYLTSGNLNNPHDLYRTFNYLDMVDPISQNESTKGFVREAIVYVATDNLVVSPISSISAISLINSMNTTLGDIEEKEFNIGLREGLSILKASLTSSLALTKGLAHLLTNVRRENYLLTKVKDEKCVVSDQGLKSLISLTKKKISHFYNRK
ncbi:PREDICTED: uncharacterized protein LOC109352990 [Lupinus angustifolius]|uniref:uncharacterized protein LOC109352990 n=1 Tax=Lupinus angustifolius TaxID=3871 RepID=UPI00092F8DA8|nr:PREDICTED: uncharacterized protein LOC109352990 [Lupinus angustifolius]